ncbi:MAG: hypothetical protein JKX76_00830 [Colwellia sp.]|nr:hypothetical protein [Colwellia sp.]
MKFKTSIFIFCGLWWALVIISSIPLTIIYITHDHPDISGSGSDSHSHWWYTQEETITYLLECIAMITISVIIIIFCFACCIRILEHVQTQTFNNQIWLSNVTQNQLRDAQPVCGIKDRKIHHDPDTNEHVIISPSEVWV